LTSGSVLVLPAPLRRERHYLAFGPPIKEPTTPKEERPMRIWPSPLELIDRFHREIRRTFSE